MTIKEQKDQARSILSKDEMDELEMHIRNLRNLFLFVKDHEKLELFGRPSDWQEQDEDTLKEIEEFLCV